MEALWLALVAGAGLATVGGACVWWLGRFARLLDTFGRLGEDEVREGEE